MTKSFQGLTGTADTEAAEMKEIYGLGCCAYSNPSSDDS